MPLSDIAIRSAKPGPKPVKLSDEKGLFLLIAPSGGKLWRFKYRIAGKEKKLALGRYTDVALKDARERCAEARKLIAAGGDPSEKKRVDRIDATLKAATTFKAVADEYIAKCEREGRADVTVGKARWLLSLLEPALGPRPVDEVSPVELLAALRKVEARGHLETARRMRSFSSRVFRYAVSTARASADPAAALRGALVAPTATHHAAILDSKGVGALLRAIDGYDGQPMTQLALQLAPGRRPPQAPRWTINLGAQQTAYFGNGATLVFTAQAHYQTKTMTALEFFDEQYQHSYWTVDASATYNAPSKRWFAGLFMNNIGNRTVSSSINLLPFATTNYFVALLRDPRTYGVRLGFKF